MDFVEGRRFRVIGNKWRSYSNFDIGAIVAVEKVCPYGDDSYHGDPRFCHFKLIQLPPGHTDTGHTTKGKHGRNCLHMQKDQVTPVCMGAECVLT